MPDNNADKALIGRSIDSWDLFLKNYVPASDQLLAQTAVNQSDISRAAGQASAAASGAFAAPGMVLGGGTRPGGTTVRDAGRSSDAMSAAVARGVSAADRQAKMREIQGKLRVAALGRGIADNSTLSLADAGRTATANAIADEQQRTDLTHALVSGAASGAGMYLGYRKQ
jgi:hypothetical protein